MFLRTQVGVVDLLPFTVISAVYMVNVSCWPAGLLAPLDLRAQPNIVLCFIFSDNFLDSGGPEGQKTTYRRISTGKWGEMGEKGWPSGWPSAGPLAFWKYVSVIPPC